MANLEVGIGADISDLLSGIDKAEKEIKKLEKQQQILVKANLDTSGLDTKIKDSKANLEKLRGALNQTSDSFAQAKKPMGDASNTLTNFSRIAQDAPFGIIGIGNNLTATAEAFSSLSKQAGGAGGALKALGSSLLGGGGVLLAISLVTTALTVMSQKGITVGDVFDKLSGNFNQFKKDLSEVNKEAAKNSAEEVQRVKSLTEVAKDETLTRQKRLVAVQKLQDEYPAYFGNLTKEQILTGNVGTAIKDVIAAIKEKARAQALSGKLTDLAAKEFELREKEAPLIKQVNDAILEQIRIQKRLQNEGSTDRTRQQLSAATDNVRRYKDELAGVQDELRGVISETNKWATESAKATKKSILLEFKPEKVKKVKELVEQTDPVSIPVKMGLIMPDKFDLDKQLNQQYKSTTFDPFKSLSERMEESRKKFIDRLKSTVTQTTTVLFSWNAVLGNALGDIGTTIGDALANGGNVLQSVGSSLINSIGSLLSAIGDKLITVGLTAVLAGTALATMFTPAGIAAGFAAIAGGIALKAGGSLLGGLSKKMSSSGGNSSNVSAGNSVSNPTSSVSSSSYSGGFQNVVFEISGQSLVGVLSNTLNKNVKLGGVPAI